MKKKLISFALALLMVLSLLPVAAFAETCPTCNGTKKVCTSCSGDGLCVNCESPGNGKCAHCEGNGTMDGGRECNPCDGSGECAQCNGTGECPYCEPCSACGGSGQLAHTHEKGTNHSATNATCEAAGTVEYWDCTGDCGKKLDKDAKEIADITIPAKGHDFSGTLVQGTDGNVGKHAAKCANCDAYGTVIGSVDTKGWVDCVCDQTSDTTHQKSPADCTNAEVCYKTCVCGYCAESGETFANGNPLGHSFDTENWTTDETQHWHAATCEHTGEKSNVGNHVDEDVKDHKCDVCGYVMSKCKDETGDSVCDICGKEMPKGFDFSGLLEHLFNLIRFKKATDGIKAFSIITVIIAFIRNIIEMIFG